MENLHIVSKWKRICKKRGISMICDLITSYTQHCACVQCEQHHSNEKTSNRTHTVTPKFKRCFSRRKKRIRGKGWLGHLRGSVPWPMSFTGLVLITRTYIKYTEMVASSCHPLTPLHIPNMQVNSLIWFHIYKAHF